MKTAIAALLLSGTAMKPALAQDCTSPTRCDELGYTMSKDDCDGIKSLVCPFDSSKYFCVEAGDSAASKTPVGIVAYVAGATGLAIALTETMKSWGGYSLDVSCLTDYDNNSSAQTDFKGDANTQCLIYDSNKTPHPAAEYCNTYKPVSSGTGSSGWYLPAAGELYVSGFSYRAINSGLQKLSKTQLSNDYYWSSSGSINNNYAWRVNLSNGTMYGTSKNSSISVRCFLAF